MTAMVALIAGLRGRISVLLVEHDMDAVFALADRIRRLVAGREIATGSPRRFARIPAFALRIWVRRRSARLGSANARSRVSWKDIADAGDDKDPRRAGYAGRPRLHHAANGGDRAAEGQSFRDCHPGLRTLDRAGRLRAATAAVQPPGGNDAGGGVSSPRNRRLVRGTGCLAPHRDQAGEPGYCSGHHVGSGRLPADCLPFDVVRGDHTKACTGRRYSARRDSAGDGGVPYDLSRGLGISARYPRRRQSQYARLAAFPVGTSTWPRAMGSLPRRPFYICIKASPTWLMHASIRIIEISACTLRCWCIAKMRQIGWVQSCCAAKPILLQPATETRSVRDSGFCILSRSGRLGD